MSEDFDRTLLQIPLVYVFKIPTRMSAGKSNILLFFL